MAFLSAADKEQIVAAIRAAEAKTSGQLVTVVARASDDYLQIPLLWATFIALLLPGLVLLVSPNVHLVHLFELQILVFMGVVFFLHWQPIKMFLVPTHMKRAHAQRLARAQFFTQGLHFTHAHTGILLFVSVAERYVEIIADSGIHARMQDGEWDAIVGQFVRYVKAGEVAQGFVTALNACGDKLAQHFPHEANGKNELPDRLIEL